MSPQAETASDAIPLGVKVFAAAALQKSAKRHFPMANIVAAVAAENLPSWMNMRG
jgi:hypothetical protein